MIMDNKMMKEYLPPVAVEDSKDATNTEILLSGDFLHACFNDGVTLCEVKEGGYIMLDFGKEIVGTVRIIADLPCTIRLRTGESYAETVSDLGYKGSVNAHTPRDASGIIIPAWSDTENFNTAFRYVRIDVTKGTFKA